MASLSPIGGATVTSMGDLRAKTPRNTRCAAEALYTGRRGSTLRPATHKLTCRRTEYATDSSRNFDDESDWSQP
jgi:hypothetical protein